MTTLPPPIADLLKRGTRFEETTLQGFRSAWRDLLSWVRENEPDEGAPSEGPRGKGSPGEGPSSEGPPGESNLDEEELPSPTRIAEYLRDRMHLAWSTLASRRQAIRYVYQELGEEDPFDHPDVEEVWEQVVEEKRGDQPQGEKRRLAERDHSPADIIERGPDLLSGHLSSETALAQDSLQYLPEKTARSESLSAAVQALIPEPAFDLSVLRDRAILLLVATTEQPRKSLVGIDLEDIKPPEQQGSPTRIVMYNSAGDPASVLRLETVPSVRYCPNRAVAAWILSAGLESGPLFRPFNPRGGFRGGPISPQTLNVVTKRRAEEAGLDPGDWSTTKLRERE